MYEYIIINFDLKKHFITKNFNLKNNKKILFFLIKTEHLVYINIYKY
jgi:hypothetical protein